MFSNCGTHLATWMQCASKTRAESVDTLNAIWLNEASGRSVYTYIDQGLVLSWYIVEVSIERCVQDTNMTLCPTTCRCPRLHKNLTTWPLDSTFN